MNTRRNFVRGLTGIGAIVATGHAPAIVKSMIAARGTMLVGAHAWTNPYITDSLVAMWDVEWNAGGGMHDPNATVWKDLSGHNKDFSWQNGTSGLSWADNYIELSNSNKVDGVKIASVSNVTGLTAGSERTCEIVMSFKWVFLDNPANVQVPFSLNGAAFPSGRYNGYIVPFVSQRGNDRYIAFGQTQFLLGEFEIASASIAQTPTSPCSIHCNGDVDTVTVNYQGFTTEEYDAAFISLPTRADARLYSVRIYSRALTADEIAANYAIDKQRFRLAS